MIDIENFLHRLQAGYVGQLFPLSTAVEVCIKLACVLLSAIANIKGAEGVAVLSTLFTVFIILPFAVEPFAVTHWHTQAWTIVPKDIDWALFISSSMHHSTYFFHVSLLSAIIPPICSFLLRLYQFARKRLGLSQPLNAPQWSRWSDPRAAAAVH